MPVGVVSPGAGVWAGVRLQEALCRAGRRQLREKQGSCPEEGISHLPEAPSTPTGEVGAAPREMLKS